jgi:hypothetical protein
MHPVVRASLVLAAAVAVVSILLYVTGLHRNFVVSQTGFLVIAIGLNVAIVIWALSATAATNTYLQQLRNAVGIGLLAGALIVAASWLLLSVVFPDVLAETREGAIAYMEQSDMPPDEVARQMEAIDSTTAISQSMAGGIGTLFTSIATGAVFAIWRRRK